MATQIGTAFIDVEARTDSASGALSRFASGAVKAIAGVVAGIGAIGAGLTGLAVKGGISRALDTEDAIVQMRRIGLSAQEIEGVVADVDKAFDGTIFTNPEGFALTQRLIGAGVELDAVGGHVQTIGDFAAHGNVPLDRMSSIFERIIQQERVGAEELNRLADANVPLGALADTLGKTVPELRQMASDGELTADLFLEMAGNAEMFQGAAKAAGDTTRGAFSNARAQLARLGELMVGPLFGEGGPLVDLFQALRQALIDVRPAAEAVGSVVASVLVPAVQSLTEWLGEGGLANAVSRAQELLAGFGSGSFDMGSMFEGIIAAAQNVFARLIEWLTTGGIQSIFNALIRGRQRLIEAAMVLFPAIVDGLVQTLPVLIETITGTLIPAILDFIVSGVPMLLDAALTLFHSLVDALIELLPELLDTLATVVLPAVLTAIIDMVPELLTAAVEAFTALVDALVEILPDLIRTLLVVVLPKVLTTIVGMVPKLLTAAVTAFLALVQGVVKVLPELIGVLVGEVLPALITTIVDMAPELLVAMFTAAIELGTGIIQALPEIVTVIVTQLIPGIVAALGTLVGKVVEIGKDLVRGIWEGITSLGGWLRDKVGGWVQDNILGPVGRFLGIASPSRVFAGFGRAIVAGLAGGITGSVPAVQQAVDRLARAVPARFGAGIDLSPFAAAGRGQPVSRTIHVQTTGDAAVLARQIVGRIHWDDAVAGRVA